MHEGCRRLQAADVAHRCGSEPRELGLRACSNSERDERGSRGLESQVRVMMSAFAYLLLIRDGLNNVIHQYRHEFRHSMDSSGEGAVLGRAVDGLALRLGLLEPLPGHGVYDVEHA